MRPVAQDGSLALREPLTKRCRACGVEKHLGEMKRDARRPLGRDTVCQECDRERFRRRYAENTEAERERRRRYRDEHLEAERERERKSARRRIARLSARTDEQIAADCERHRPSGRKRCRSCHEIRELDEFAADRSRLDGLAQVCRRCDDARKAARLRKVAATFSDESACYICGSADTSHVEHVVPRRRGGDDSPANLAFACESCNLSKNASDPGPWLRDRMGEEAAWSFVRERLSARVILFGAPLQDA